MRPECPYRHIHPHTASGNRKIVRLGSYRRKSDGRRVKRFRCNECGKGFSHATRSACYKQNKRHLNDRFRKLFASGISQRRLARLFSVSRTTVVRKHLFLASQSRGKVQRTETTEPVFEIVEFDDLETFEHTKFKPLSVFLAVEYKTRRVIDLEVARMPAKGKLSARALKKYGPREDERPAARRRLFERIQSRVSSVAIFKSDMNPHYPLDLKRAFPHAEHRRFKGRRGCIVGQGELKRGGFDPLFSFNHTAAMFRANVNRLFRRTWNTTKRPDRLADHLMIYAHYHNSTLI